MLLFPIAIFTPFVLSAVLLLPAYLGILSAAYIIYMPASGGAHPIEPYATDVFYILDIYGKLYDYWSATAGLSFVDFTLPLFGPPLFGILLGMYGVYRLIRWLMNVVHLSSAS